MADALLFIKQQAERIAKMKEDDPRDKTFNAIVFGQPKVGKTELIRTMVKPILVHSFDPGGTKVIDDLIEKGEVVADTRWEVDNPKDPTCYKNWQDEMTKLINAKFFEHCGTFVIDSMTTWSQVIMYDVIAKAAMKKAGRVKGGAPQQQDYIPQMNEIEQWMRRFVGLPCNCVLLGHDDTPTDADGTPIDDRRLMITGKLSKRVPALFDEVYYYFIKNTSSGERALQTQPRNRISAGTRLGKGGKLELYEPPDIKAILKKVGMPYADKTLFKDLA